MSQFIPFDQVANRRDWDDYFRNAMPEQPTDMLLHEYPNWLKIKSANYGCNFDAISKFIKDECEDTVLWREDDPYSTPDVETSFATLYFKNSNDLVAFELRFGEITEAN